MAVAEFVVIIAIARNTARVAGALYCAMVFAAVEITIIVSLARYTTMIAVACGGNIGIVGKFFEVGVVAIADDASGVTAASHRATHREVVNIGSLRGACTQNHAEQTTVLCSTCYFEVADGFVVAVEMTFERSGHCFANHTPVAERGKVEVVDDFEINVVEIHTAVHALRKSIESVGCTNQVWVGLGAATAAESGYVVYPDMFLHSANSARKLCGTETGHCGVGAADANNTGHTAGPAYAVGSANGEVMLNIANILAVGKENWCRGQFGAEAVAHTVRYGVEVGCSREISSARVSGHAHKCTCEFCARSVGCGTI